MRSLTYFLFQFFFSCGFSSVITRKQPIGSCGHDDVFFFWAFVMHMTKIPSASLIIFLYFFIYSLNAKVFICVFLFFVFLRHFGTSFRFDFQLFLAKQLVYFFPYCCYFVKFDIISFRCEFLCVKLNIAKKTGEYFVVVVWSELICSSRRWIFKNLSFRLIPIDVLALCYVTHLITPISILYL